MTKTVTVERYNRGKLRNAVKTDEGYYLVEGYVAKPGVLEYRLADGSIRRELVPEDELHRADSLATLARKPVTLLIANGIRLDEKASVAASAGIVVTLVGLPDTLPAWQVSAPMSGSPSS